ncbi:MAG TPA: DHHA1 domain-containing protein, partial [Bdellovibrionota bacterium]|nr:DHHA1 domain-containing protein [Bdellovibrionota bacterium]
LGAMALFGEKYGERVRVISVGDYSKELCGGTHVSNTSEIRLFTIVSDSSIASGVRRIEALTGDKALEYLSQSHQELTKISDLLKSHPAEALSKLDRIIKRQKELERELSKLKLEQTKGAGEDLLSQVEEVKGIKILAAEISIDNPQDLRNISDQLKQKIKSGVVALGASVQGKACLVVSVTKDLTKSLNAGDLIKEISKAVGGSGGGRADFAQAGGPDLSGIPKALKQLKEIVRKRG